MKKTLGIVSKRVVHQVALMGLAAVLAGCANHGGGTTTLLSTGLMPATTAYVVELREILLHESKIKQCTLAADGSLLGCKDSGATGFFFPIGLSIKGATAYVAAAGSRDIIQCAIAPDGSLSGCKSADLPVRGRVLSPSINSGFFYYIPDPSGNTIIKCAIGEGGELAGCKDSGATGLKGPVNVVFKVIVFNGVRSYIANPGNNSILSCTVRADGQLSSCVEKKEVLFNQPRAMAIKGTTLYVKNSDSPNKRNTETLVQCVIEVDGSIGVCKDAGVSQAVLGKTLNLAVNGSILYLPNADGYIVQCTIGTDGSLSACTNKKVPGLVAPVDMAFR